MHNNISGAHVHTHVNLNGLSDFKPKENGKFSNMMTGIHSA